MSRYTAFLNDIGFLLRHADEHHLVYSINVSLQHRTIFFETPKAACSTIKRFLIANEWRDATLPKADDLTYDQFGEFHDRRFSPLLDIRQLHPFSRCLEPGRFFKFCFVRHPYDRLLSAYLDKVVHHRAQSVQIKLALGRPAYEPADIGFDEFVEAVCAMPVFAMDPHWKVQAHHLCMPQFPYDFVGKVETIADDLEIVCERTGLDISLLERFSPHEAGASERRADYYTPRLETLVQEKYAVDFKTFGYAP